MIIVIIVIIDDQLVASLFSLSQRQRFSAWSEFFDEDLTSRWEIRTKAGSGWSQHQGKELGGGGEGWESGQLWGVLLSLFFGLRSYRMHIFARFLDHPAVWNDECDPISIGIIGIIGIHFGLPPFLNKGHIGLSKPKGLELQVPFHGDWSNAGDRHHRQCIWRHSRNALNSEHQLQKIKNYFQPHLTLW